MSVITVEDFVANIDDVLSSIGNEKLVNWDVVESTENDLMK